LTSLKEEHPAQLSRLPRVLFVARLLWVEASGHTLTG
jgi:hypothetical protein